MPPLAPELRHDLDKAVVAARGLAEAGARAALDRLGVEDAEAPAGLAPEQRTLRTALRERAKALGGGARHLGFPLLAEEIAYEQWHRMLFARFLAENGLLLHPEGAPVSLAEVRELAAEEGERDPWVLAARYAAAMLPGIFRADDPANRVEYAPEDRSRLEAVLEQLPASLFTADDALGWVYQFWQSERKDEVNKRGDKIGAWDLPSVTQLFTEHYMVRFLLENSLGAWWAGRHPDSPLLREWKYLRFRDDGSPAAGTFEDWPARASEVTVMDPCCGSGHFLVAAADMLRKMRMEEQGLTPAQVATEVIRDNLFGLELDARCLQLAAFNLALDAWKTGGYQPLPIPNLGCSGIAIKGQRADWHRLAGGDERMRLALNRLYDLFQDAPELGSLIDPRSAAGDGLWAVDVDELLAKLDRALQAEAENDPAAEVFGEAAVGTAKAAKLLAGRYWLVATNPPFLGRGKQVTTLRQSLTSMVPVYAGDLATALLARGSSMTVAAGLLAFITTENWMTQRSFAMLRREFLTTHQILGAAPLGEEAFQSFGRRGPRSVLLLARVPPRPIGEPREDRPYFVLDVRAAGDPSAKAALLADADLRWIRADDIAPSADGSLLYRPSPGERLSDYATSWQGLVTGDSARYISQFWELVDRSPRWTRLVTAPGSSGARYSGRDCLLRWEGGQGSLVRRSTAHNFNPLAVLGTPGVLMSQMRALRATIYLGEMFNQGCVPIIPNDATMLPALWAFVTSPNYPRAIRAINQKVSVDSGYFLDVPFDLEHWQKIAAEKYPNGLPEPHSDDPTQWLFKGDIISSEAPLHVAVARLVGYRWPDQEPDALDELVDVDGLVPLVSVSGERPASDRLRAVLARAYGDAWSPALLERLLADAGSPGSTLETWLRDDFFSQHAKLFHQRPFIWHVWDGLRDGFGVLCHYHRLDRATLEKLTYTLLGDWIERQRAAGDEPGAESRLAAALALQEKLGLILKGEAPHDIYVRWKSLSEQPIGWEPDPDDGVRLNIRPFVTAGILRSKVSVKWDKDRGQDPDGSERINDRHLSLADKRAARAAGGRR
jgi:hypothetical protein